MHGNSVKHGTPLCLCGHGAGLVNVYLPYPGRFTVKHAVSQADS